MIDIFTEKYRDVLSAAAEGVCKKLNVPTADIAVEINMVFCKINKSEKLLRDLPNIMYKKGIKINDGGFHGMFRFLTSNDVTKDDIDVLISELITVFAENK